MTKEMKQEFTFRITRANSTDMIVILYDMALYYIDEAKQSFEMQDQKENAFHNISLCKNVLGELLKSLHLEYEPAPTLRKLYLYAIRQLTIAQIREEGELLCVVENILRPLREAYQEIAPTNTEGAIMGNSQEVYAGLTYGKNDLHENIQDQGSNRGYLV